MELRIISFEDDLSIDFEFGLDKFCIPPRAEFVVIKEPLYRSIFEMLFVGPMAESFPTRQERFLLDSPLVLGLFSIDFLAELRLAFNSGGRRLFDFRLDVSS